MEGTSDVWMPAAEISAGTLQSYQSTPSPMEVCRFLDLCPFYRLAVRLLVAPSSQPKRVRPKVHRCGNVGKRLLYMYCNVGTAPCV